MPQINYIHEKILKLEEHMKNYKIENKIKDDTIDKPKCKVSAMEHEMSNDFTPLRN